MSITEYPLKNSAILDSGSTLHVFNEIARFINFRRAPDMDVLWAGDSPINIIGYGDVDISIIGLKSRLQKLRLFNVAYCPNFATNLVSLRQLQKMDYWWDNRPLYNCLRRADNTIVAHLKDRHGQFVLEDIPNDHPKMRMAFFIRRNKFNSWSARKPVKADAIKWHLRMGHPGPEAMRHLVNSSTGVRLKGPTTVQCEACGTSKAKRTIRRYPRHIEQLPGVRLALDFHDFEASSINNFKCLMLVTDRYSGLIWDYYLSDRQQGTILLALQHLFNYLDRQYKIKPLKMECDNEILKRPKVKDWLHSQEHVDIEPSPPDTQALDGAAERSGGVVKDKARAMRDAAKLPADLSPEIYRTAVYLLNRTPRYQYKWKSPYERFHSFLANRDGLSMPDFRPQQAHLKVYGCKAFALTPDYMKKRNRLKRFNPKAWIGYLVGYDSTNVYRVWNPVKNAIIKARDVIFDEDEVFNGDLERLRDDVRDISLPELAELLTKTDVTQGGQILGFNSDSAESSTEEDTILLGNPLSVEESVEDINIEEDLDQDQISANQETEKSLAGIEEFAYPTPPETPPAALLSTTIQNSDDLDTLASNLLGQESKRFDSEFQPWKAAFLAGQRQRPVGKVNGKVVDRDRIDRIIRKGMLSKLHRRDLPDPPRRHEDLASHPMGQEFEKAERNHLASHIPTKSWTKIDGWEAKGEQILSCMWVYVYKFNKHGRLQKCKARLVVRGDQQTRNELQDTYAATLAGRSFRTFMAIAARFDLELKQYDAVNAFMNAQLETPVYMRMPPGYRENGKVYRLNKALYGLRISPLLWQRTLTCALADLGFQTIPHEPCCMIKNSILIFFYVDDIVLAYRKRDESEAKRLIGRLQDRYTISGGEDLQWFLGIRVIRDRSKKLIWLSQAAYIDKISRLADSFYKVKTPMTKEELMPYKDVSTLQSKYQYQRKVGSLMYAAVNTRPDIAFAVSRLARFLTNPGPVHHNAADRVLNYLKLYSTYSLQLGGSDNFTVASDASFADNSLDRKSSQAYVMTLFGGVIGWQANKQGTVTTSTTEAELLALSQAAKEGLYISRLLKELDVRLDNHKVQIDCDNKQTIRLVNAEVARLQTKLRHVDIHNHWIRQEVKDGRIDVQYMPTKKMIANGLTKALGEADFREFLKQINLVDISVRLDDDGTNAEREIDPEKLIYPDED
jgi:hypothetical protein